MTYNAGNTIVATDFMGLRGANSPSVSYTSDATATNKVAALIGVGFGQRGYGVTGTTLPAVVGNTSIVTATVWNNLRSAMSVINTHTGANLALQPVVSTSNVIVANDGRPSLTNIPALISTLDTNRFDVGVGQSTTTPNLLVSTKTVAWTNTVFHEFSIIFSVEDQARYFFNTGGKIQLSASRTGGTPGGVNPELTTMLAAMGNISFGAINTSYTGTGGTANVLGYYGLTNVYQTAFVINGTGAFPDISYSVLVRRENFVGQNGGNGSLVRFRAFFDISNYISEIADGTLVSSISSIRSTGAVNISNPTFATSINL
jgi:hypothetical protein